LATPAWWEKSRCPAATARAEFRNEMHLVRVGASYRF
jgi:hypothetical protein